MYVGFQAKFFALLGGLAPRLMDELMEVWMYPSQHADRPSRDREDNALYRAGYGLHECGTHQGWIRSRSLYVKASKHPVLTTALVASFSVTLWLLSAAVTQSY